MQHAVGVGFTDKLIPVLDVAFGDSAIRSVVVVPNECRQLRRLSLALGFLRRSFISSAFVCCRALSRFFQVAVSTTVDFAHCRCFDHWVEFHPIASGFSMIVPAMRSFTVAVGLGLLPVGLLASDFSSLWLGCGRRSSRSRIASSLSQLSTSMSPMGAKDASA